MKDVTQIRIGRNQIGIIGLKEVLQELAENQSGITEDAISRHLMDRLSKKNYIVDNLRDVYAEAFLREYKKHIGEQVAGEPGEGLQIKILGPGCNRCERLERDVMSVLSENGILAELEHVRDLEEIGRYGVMGMPALIINGIVKAVGIVPSKSRIKNWLEEVDR